jgi:hypothetical protein
MVQARAEATDPSMPFSALRSAGADYCEQLETLAALLVRLVGNAPR